MCANQLKSIATVYCVLWLRSAEEHSEKKSNEQNFMLSSQTILISLMLCVCVCVFALIVSNVHTHTAQCAGHWALVNQKKEEEEEYNNNT